MIDKRDDTLKTAENLGALRALIPEEDRAPTFEVNETLVVKGYLFRVTQLTDEYGGAIIMVPHGPVKDAEDIKMAKLQRREDRALRRALQGLRGKGR